MQVQINTETNNKLSQHTMGSQSLVQCTTSITEYVENDPGLDA